MDHSKILFLDVEASSLSNQSYPIEIAWGSTEFGIEEYLIKRYPDWDDWNWRSEGIHMISKQDLHRFGKDGRIVADRLFDLKKQGYSFAATSHYDSFWMNRLMSRFYTSMEVVGCRDFNTIIYDLFPTTHPVSDSIMFNMQSEFERIYAEAKAKCPVTHRAAADVKHMIEMYTIAGERWGKF